MTNASFLKTAPANTNTLDTTRFVFTIPSLPFANFFCQTVNIPGVSTSPVMVPTPFSETWRHGDKAVFDQLTLTFLVDEELRTWEETYIWLATLTFPQKFKQFAPRFKEKYYDGILTINSNSNVPLLRIKYFNCHPISLGTVQLATTDTPDLTPIADLTLQFDYFEFERF